MVSATDGGRRRRRRLLGAAATAAAAVVVVVGGGGFRAATSIHRPRQRPSMKRAYALSIGMGRSGRKKKTSDKRTRRTRGRGTFVVVRGVLSLLLRAHLRGTFVKRTWGVCKKNLTPGQRSKTGRPIADHGTTRCKRRSRALDGSGRTTITVYTTDGTA